MKDTRHSRIAHRTSMTLSPQPFPSPDERAAASALLILSISGDDSASPPSALPSVPGAQGNTSSASRWNSKLELADSNSGAYSFTSNPSSINDARLPKIRIVTVAAHHRDFKLQVSRKLRLNKAWGLNHQKFEFNGTITKPNEVELEKTVSCLSSGSSGYSNATSQKFHKDNAKKWKASGRQIVEKPVGSVHIRLRAEAIMRFLASGSASEVKIRQALGDSPDTSKALRILLKREEVTRFGRGGRHHPFIYMIAKGSIDPIEIS